MTDIVGYTYQAENLCPDCTRNIGIMPLEDTPLTGPVPVENLLDRVARYKGINRRDEESYDSGDFPKVIFASMLDGDACGGCGETL